MWREKWRMWNATLSTRRNATPSMSRNATLSIQRNATRFQPQERWNKLKWSAQRTTMERRPARTMILSWQSVTLKRNAKRSPMRNAKKCRIKSAKISRFKFATMLWRRRQRRCQSRVAKPSKRKFAIDKILCKYTTPRLVLFMPMCYYASAARSYFLRISLSGVFWGWPGDIVGISWVYLEQILGISSAYLGHILDIIRHILDIFGGYLGNILGISDADADDVHSLANLLSKSGQVFLPMGPHGPYWPIWPYLQTCSSRFLLDVNSLSFQTNLCL